MSKIYLLSVLELPHKNTWKLRTLQENLIRCYKQQLYVDVEIRVQNRIYKAHKNILSFYSPIFQKAFYGKRTPSSICIINDVKPKGFEILLWFLYSSDIPEEVNPNYLVEACFAAQMLEMIGIQEKLLNYVFYKIKPGSKSSKPIVESKFWQLLQKAHSLKMRELEGKLLKFSEKHFQSILDNEDFAKVDSHVIKLVLKKKAPDVPESYLLERIAFWKDSNSNMKSLELSVRALLVHVSFESLTAQEFFFIASKHNNLMPKKDLLDIFMHLVDPSVCSLPKWCSVGNKSLNIPTNLSLSKGTTNPRDCYKTDKFKSLEDLRKVDDLNSVRDWRKWRTVFQSQVDLRSFDDGGNLEKWNGQKSCIEVQCYEKTLPESFNQMWEEGLLTDVVLYSKGGVKIPSHRIILALGSDVFAQMLYGATPLKALRLEETKDELTTMLKYFYGSGEKIPFKDVSSSLGLILRKIDIALKYECYPMLKACCDALFPIIVDCCAFWKLLDQMDQMAHCKVDAEVLMKYTMTSNEKLFNHESFYRASKNSLLQVLKRDCLSMPECDILEHVARWLEINAKFFPTHHSRKDILKHIRFQALNAEQFLAFLKLHGDLLPEKVSLSILMFLYTESKDGLPDWFYRGPLRCPSYDTSTKIGTNVRIPWKNSTEKTRSPFRCTYTVAISNRHLESQVQYLELSWKIARSPKKEKLMKYKWNVTIRPDDGSEPLIFKDLQMALYHRFIVPVSFTLNDQKPKIQFDVEVSTNISHKYGFIRARKMSFDNVVFEVNSPINCVSDAIVDNRTSEHTQIPKHLLSLNNIAAIPTDELLSYRRIHDQDLKQ